VAEIVNRMLTDVAVEYSKFALVDPEAQTPPNWPGRVDEEAGDGTVTAKPEPGGLPQRGGVPPGERGTERVGWRAGSARG
jgi:hypothetical protein